MELTGEQRQVVDHDAGLMRVEGGPGTGKTTALVARYLLLAQRHRASDVLVLCRRGGAADRFRDAVLPALAGGFDSLPITTFVGLAYDLVARADGPVRLLTGAEQARVVARLLADENAAAWPALGHLLGRSALVGEVIDGLQALQSRPSGAAASTDPAWVELERFLPRYRRALTDLGRVDPAGLSSRAADLAPLNPRFAHVLIDDFETAELAADGVVRALAAAAQDMVVASDPEGAIGGPSGADRRHQPQLDAAAHVDLGTVSFRKPAPPVLVTCRHPSLEVESIAAELLSARSHGVDWSDMAVLVRRPVPRARRIARALARHGIPATVSTAALVTDDPVVSSVVDMLRWIGDDATALDRLLVSPLSRLDPLEARAIRRRARADDTSGAMETHPRLGSLVALRDELATRVAVATPAELAFEIWREGLGHLVVDGDSLDGLVGFLDGLNDDAERDPGLRLPDLLAALDVSGREIDTARVSRAVAADAADAVTVSSLLGAAGREWHTVVLAGCVEGELPSIQAREAVFDQAVLAGRARPAPAERRREALAEERRLFSLACSRPTSRLVGIAAPQPGVLLSRFVEAWACGVVELVDPPADTSARLPPTTSHVPVVSGTGLILSATQLDTYDDCPLRYAYRYVVRVRDAGGVRADLGSLVHDVLARFLDPGGDVPRTRETLLELGRQLWRDDIARYRPQVEEARRDFFAMLDNWWAAEGEGPLAPEILAVEHPFDIEVGGHRLVGAIDRIDRIRSDDANDTDDTGAGGIRILDYKTGKAEPTRAQVGSNLQLAVYHLAATRDPALAGLGPPTQLRLLFLRSMRYYDQEVTTGLAEATEARIVDVAERIRAEDFEPSVEANCRWCSFQRLCPIQPEGRQIESWQLESWPANG